MAYSATSGKEQAASVKTEAAIRGGRQLSCRGRENPNTGSELISSAPG